MITMNRKTTSRRFLRSLRVVFVVIFFACITVHIVQMPGFFVRSYSEQLLLLVPVLEQNEHQATSNTQDTAREKRVPNNILFVHVGKSGGETIRHLTVPGCNAWGNISECMTNLPNYSRFTDLVKGYMHVGHVFPNRKAIATSDAYLFTLRHPVDRIVSWFHYTNPSSCINGQPHDGACRTIEEDHSQLASFFFYCFPSQTDLLRVLDNNNDKEKKCRAIVLNVLKGRNPGETGRMAPWSFREHAEMNLAWYEGQTVQQFPDKPILVVRAGHLWNDISKLDVMLGGNGDFGNRTGLRVTHGSHVYLKGVKDLSVLQYQKLCCILLDEMAIYYRLLTRAANLNNEERMTTLKDALGKCGADSWDALGDFCKQSVRGTRI